VLDIVSPFDVISNNQLFEKHTVGLGEDVVDCLVDCNNVISDLSGSSVVHVKHTAVNCICLLVWDFDAELLLNGHDDLHGV
jgi:hypothetical protein